MTIIALIGLVVLLGLSIFQLLLVVGKPLGEYAWGGQHKVLPQKLRVGSAISIILYLIFALFLVSKAGIVSVITSTSLLTIGTWVLAGYFALGVVMNAISRSKKERMVMTPVALVLAIIFFATAAA